MTVLRGLLIAALLALPGCRGERVVHQGPIVLVTIDTLRADVVGGLGGVKGLTPNLDALIEEATWAGRAVAASSWTVPSMASIFTGLQPWRHGSWLSFCTPNRWEVEGGEIPWKQPTHCCFLGWFIRCVFLQWYMGYLTRITS